jgi:hypothetical protein
LFLLKPYFVIKSSITSSYFSYILSSLLSLPFCYFTLSFIPYQFTVPATTH